MIVDLGNPAILWRGAGGYPVDLEFNSTDNKVYCANNDEDIVTVYDGASNDLIATVPTDAEPYALFHNAIDDKVYCANHGSGTITVIDGATNGAIETIPVETWPRHICQDTDNDWIYVVNRYSNTVSIIDGVGDSVLHTVAVNTNPEKALYVPAEERVFVLNINGSCLSVIKNDPPVSADDSDPAVPGLFTLKQNYPNPFNPATRISYSLRRQARVSIDVFNILGQCVSTIVDEDKPAGEYEVVWDGTDALGNAVASGIYFYRLKAEGFAEAKKMVLLK